MTYLSLSNPGVSSTAENEGGKKRRQPTADGPDVVG